MVLKPKKKLLNISRPEPENINRKNFYRFDRNERTDLFDLKVFEKLMNQIDAYDLIAYPNLMPLYESIASYHSIDKEKILLTSGGDQGVKMIFETYITKKDNVINTYPNYAMYSVYTQMFGAGEIILNYDQNLTLDIENLINQINSKTKLITISNPGHNGICIPTKKIVKILKAAKKTKTLVIIDEAYSDFSGNTAIKLINNFENLILLRTMSKAFGIASLRVGYLISNQENINNIYKVKPVHEISGVSFKIAKYLIDNEQIKNNYVNEVNQSKKTLIKFFKKQKIKYYESDTNFMYFSLNQFNNDFYDFLITKKVYIKKAPNTAPFSNFLRITIGNNEQILMFISNLKSFFNEKNK